MDLTISSIVRTGNSSTIDSFDGEHNIYSFSPISSVVVRKFSHDISLENFLTEKETKLKDTNKYDDISDSEESAFEDMSDNYVEWNIALSPSLGTDDLQFLIRNFEEQEDYDNPEKDEHISGKKTSNYCIFIGIENSEMVSEEEKSNFVYKDNICVKNESLKDIKSNTDDGQFNVNNSLKVSKYQTFNI